MHRPTVLTLPRPRGFDLRRVVCSYGYFLLHPNHWDPQRRLLGRVLRDGSGRPVRSVIEQHDKVLRVTCSRAVSPSSHRGLKRQVGRMLRLDEDQRAWQRSVRGLDPALAGRNYGRMFRSPTLFEDMVKTMTSCNVTWRNTITMNRLLCEHVGDGGFPTPRQVIAFGTDALRTRCKVGYRAERIVRLAERFGEDDQLQRELEDDAAETGVIYERLLKLHGIGPYAAGNICHLLGRYERLAIDSETYRHFSQHHRVPRPAAQDLAGLKRFNQQITEHYHRYQPYAFKAYWFELWSDYEARFGRAWTWDRDTTGTQFTAAVLQP